MGATDGLWLRENVYWWCAGKPKQAITYNWAFILILSLITFIVACSSAAQDADHDGHGAISFAGVWSSIVLLILGGLGTVTLRTHHNHLAIGIFGGIIFIMCSQMLIVFALYAEHAHKFVSEGHADAENAMCVFTFLLFLAFASFGGMLVAFQDDVIKVDNSQNGPDTGYDDSM
jgi:hypothetical protein